MHMNMCAMKIGHKGQTDKGYLPKFPPPRHTDIEKEHSHRHKETPDTSGCAWGWGAGIRFAGYLAFAPCVRFGQVTGGVLGLPGVPS